ncbi:hypothetical protein [Catellatospora tritici]|uniref:hypothetical protein n=1 Tax=Catellatospora tritici TaxID=2851566 RepID=UPI001C2D26EB|nr:hypothetical protein [Catellatospora tritici]MBV1850525.1 hypothetical protein [Catellatospora tritici]
MTAKELPLADPIAFGYHFYAFPLAVMGTDDRSRDWILSNYIHLAYDESPGSPVPFCFCLYDYAISPWLEVVRANRDWINGTGVDPVRFCRDAIDAGYYVYLNLDDYYVPSRPGYGVRNGSHDILLCGLDDAARTFSTFGFTKEDVIRRSTIGFEQLRLAYRSLDVVPNWCPQVYLYRVRQDASYDFNFRLVRRSFEDYLNGANVSIPFEMFQPAWTRRYGIDSYAPLQEYLADYVAGKAEYSIHFLHVLWEHKRLMRQRLDRMAELLGDDLAELATEGRSLEKQAFQLRNRMLFREMSGKASEFGPAQVEQLSRMRDVEQRVLEQAVELLRDRR